MTRIAICAPSRPISLEDQARVKTLAAEFPSLELYFQPQCFYEEGHFAGRDDERLETFVACANYARFDAVWFARGGYGANRIAEAAIAQLRGPARRKTYLGYSDTGYLLAGLYDKRIGQPVHAPMVADIRRDGGEDAVRRTLAWLAGDRSGEVRRSDTQPTVAFNLITLAMACGTNLMPDLTGHVVIVEEVSEHLYAVDRLFFHLTAHLGGIAGLRLGRVGNVPENDVAFGAEPEQIARYWCERHSIPFLGLADIGHDSDNKIVPFGIAGA